LRNSTLTFDEVNYAKTKLDEATVKAIVAKAGSVGAVLNTRHAIAKEKGWVDNPPSAEVFAKAVTSEPNLLRRPILVIGNKIIIGFDKPAYAKL
jgi:arsenate reductase-like glutaredoxin family protein